MRRILSFMGSLIIALPLVFPGSVQAIPLDSLSTSVDQVTHNVLFTLQFNGVPTFQVADQFNRQQDSFQIYILNRRLDDIFRSQPQPDGGATLRSVVRGEE